MNAIKLSVWVGEDKRLVVDLPPETPVGMVDVQILPREQAQPDVKSVTNGGHVETAAEKRARFRKLLKDAGMMRFAQHAPAGTIALSTEDLLRLGTLPPNARPTDELIDEDRGPR